MRVSGYWRSVLDDAASVLQPKQRARVRALIRQRRRMLERLIEEAKLLETLFSPEGLLKKGSGSADREVHPE